MISKDTIAKIKESVNIVDVIGEVVQLTKTGRNYLGLCPFHGEKTPSFNVAEDKQFYHCFGCGKSGDVFKFIEEHRGLSFTDSLAVVADMAGITLEMPRSAVPNRQASPHQVLYDIHVEASKFYHALLMTTKMGAQARNYLYSRGLTEDVLTYFQLGLAADEPNLLYQHLSKKFDETSLLQSGLFNTGENNMIYDAFQGRIMFPLTDEYGRVVAFSGRIWLEKDQADKRQAKYKNTRSTAIFNKSYELYHLDKAKASIKKQHEVYLMEGFMDVFAAYRSGLENAVASMGTALTPEHVEHLKQYCKKVIIAYDGDSAGQEATSKSLDLLGDFQVEVVRLPNGMDPDEFIQKASPQALHRLLTQSRMSQVEFLIQHLKPANLDNLQQQIAFVDQIVPLIAQTKSITAQHSYIFKLAELLPDFNVDQIEMEVNRLRLSQRQQKTSQQQRPIEVALPYQPRISSLVRAENQLLYRMVQHAYILNSYRLREDFFFHTRELQILFELLKEYGEIDRVELEKAEEVVQQAWYRVLEEKLPETVGSGELEELEKNRNRQYLKRDNRMASQVIREQTHIGNEDAAVDELQRLIAQKRNME